jgi:hypothetical protein
MVAYATAGLLAELSLTIGWMQLVKVVLSSPKIRRPASI